MEKHTYVIRVVRNAPGQLAGQLSDPVQGWRRPFDDPETLWQLLIAGIEVKNDDSSHSNPTTPYEEL